MNNRKEDINKETLFGGIAVMCIGLVMTGISMLTGVAGSKLSNFRWRNPKHDGVKQEDEKFQ